ncbi:aminotransferase class III-fold pyridoxal phosphate-dependent enzyme, partial [Pseudomonas aeruginosa]
GYASLKIMRDENLAQNAQERGEYLTNALRQLSKEYPCIGNVRGRGLMMGIDIVDERQSKDATGAYPRDCELAAAIQKACVKNKLLLERGGRGGNVVRVLCAVNIKKNECEEFIKRFKQAVATAS